jgi:outer membrane immunogenic protein
MTGTSAAISAGSIRWTASSRASKAAGALAARSPPTRTSANKPSLNSIRARLGLAFDDTLIYAVGGAAFVDSKFSTDDYPTGTGYAANDSKWLTGYVIGGGIEHAFTDRISARLEYTYMGLPDADYDLYNPAIGTATVTQDFDGVHTVMLGVSYNFGW